MIDVHFHCLPGVDDGPRTMDESVELCRAASSEGVRTIIATPHVNRGLWKEHPAEHHLRLIAKLNAALGGTPRIECGSEYFFAHDMAEALEAGETWPLGRGKYVLVEFAAHAVPPMIEEAFFRVQLGGYTPLIAHPERNLVFQENAGLLRRLVERGARTQVTAASLSGHFGSAAQVCAADWMREGLVHVLASDAHNLTKRPPRWTEALEAATDVIGSDGVQALTVGNPAAILEGRELPWLPEPQESQRTGWFQRLRRFWTSTNRRP